MFASFSTSDYGIDAAAFETAMHKRLAPCHRIGEWFAAPDWLVIKVFQVTAAEFHQPELYARWDRRYGRYCRMWLRKVIASYEYVSTLHIRETPYERQRLKEGKTE